MLKFPSSRIKARLLLKYHSDNLTYIPPRICNSGAMRQQYQCYYDVKWTLLQSKSIAMARHPLPFRIFRKAASDFWRIAGVPSEARRLWCNSPQRWFWRGRMSFLFWGEDFYHGWRPRHKGRGRHGKGEEGAANMLPPCNPNTKKWLPCCTDMRYFD